MTNHLRFLYLILITQLIGCNQGKKDLPQPDRSVIVAIVGGDTLTLHDFKQFIRQEKYKNADLTLATERHKILNELVNDRLILKSAETSGLDGLDSVTQTMKTAEDEKLARRLIHEKIIYPNIPEQELMSFYEKLKIEMNVRHLFIFHNENQKIKIRSADVPYRNRKRAKEIADSLYTILKNHPDSMIDVIEAASDDQETKYQKGEIGFIPYDKFDPVFREPIFNLKIGEMTGIIEFIDGFHIFQKIGHRTMALIEPYEQLRPSILVSFAERYDAKPTKKMAEDNQKYIDSLLTAYQLIYDDKNIGMFLKRYQKIKTPTDILNAFHSDEINKNLAQFTGGTIPVRELVQVMVLNRTKVKLDVSRMRQGLRNIATTRILAMEARKQNINLLPVDKNELLEMKLSMLREIVTHRNIETPIVMDNKLVEEFYSQNLHRYRDPDRVSFLELFSPDKNLIEQYSRELKENKDFRKVGKKAEAVKGNRFGESGLIPVERKNELSLHAWQMVPGDISDPFSWSGGGYSIIQLIEKKEGQQRSFKESEEKVKRDFYQYQKKNNMNLWIAKLKDQYPVKIFENNLNEIYDVTLR